MAFALALIAHPAAAAVSGEIDVGMTNGLLNLEAQDAELGEVLHRVAETAGFELKLTEPLPVLTNVSLRYTPVLDGLQKLLSRVSWVATEMVDEDGKLRIDRVVVLRHNGADSLHNTVAIKSSLADIHDLRDRIKALQELVKSPDKTAVGDLADLVRTGDTPSRSLATIALGRLDGPEARDALLVAYNDENAVIRRWAVRGLGQGWGGGAMAELSDALLHDPDAVVRREALLRLSLVPGDEAATYLAMAENDESGVVRRVAANVIEFRAGWRAPTEWSN